MARIELSEETRRRVTALFRDEELVTAAELLANECGGNLPFCDHSTPQNVERVRYAVLKLSDGRLDRLRQAIESAKSDWRDVLMEAGFGYDIHAHLFWDPRESGRQS